MENLNSVGIQLKSPDDTALLRVRDVTAGYGKITILHGINIDVREGEIVCVIGPNGAGKSTLLNAVFGAPIAKTGVGEPVTSKTELR